MSSYAGENLFGSGPCAFRFGPWLRSMQMRAFAGPDGEAFLDLGLRSRSIVQTGRLQADAFQALQTQLDAVAARCDGTTHTLVDNHDQSHDHVLLARFEMTAPVRRGRGYYCDYEIEYRQLS